MREVAPGRLEYKEVLHWQGPAPKSMWDTESVTAAVRSALPSKLATDANVRDLTQIIEREIMHMLMGPSEPMLSQVLGQLFLNPDLAEKQLVGQIGRVLNKALEVKFGAELPPGERLALAHKLALFWFGSVKDQTKSKANPNAKTGPGNKDDFSVSFVPLMFSVKLPGKVVATNGERDEWTGETYWSLYPEAAWPGDVVLSATCEVKK